MEDPRGGVRNVIPHSADYLVSGKPSGNTQALVTGGTDPLLPHLIHHLAESVSADFAVAFTLRSGLDLLSPHLQDLLDRKGALRVLTGDYLGATDPDALLRLLDLNGNVECRVFESGWTNKQEPPSSSFHPKAYIFRRRDGSSAAFVGSSNLSETGLTRGIEWNYRALDSKRSRGHRRGDRRF